MTEFRRIKIIAHRGMGPTSKLSGKGSETEDVPFPYVPENTLKAFRQSIEEGADGIEFDIYVTQDGVPVVIHDDELNVNVIGADRNGKNLGLISEKTLEEIKQYDVGQGETIPTLQETIEFFIQYNTERAEKSLLPLIMNVELKGIGSGEKSFSLINQYINDGLISKDYVVYCSFKHDELKQIRELDSEAKISPAIKSSFLWGRENVLKPGYYIPMNIEFPKAGIEYLQNLNKELNVTAFDPVLFDIDAPLIDFVSSLGVDLYASTSDFRDFSNKAFLQLLVNMNQHVPVYFKTDEPKQIHEMLEEYEDVMTLDLSSVIILEHEEVLSLNAEQLKRIPKINQPEHTLILDKQKVESVSSKFKSIVEKLVLNIGKELKFYITKYEASHKTDALVKIIENFEYVKEYIPKILSLDQEFVQKIASCLMKTSDHIIKGDTLPNYLKLQLETLIPKLEEQEINILETQDKTTESQKNKVSYLKTDIMFFHKDLLFSSIKLLNDIILSNDDSKSFLKNDVEALKNVFHIDEYNHSSPSINDGSIATFLDNLSTQMQNEDSVDIEHLRFMVSINDELVEIFKGFKKNDKINEAYWEEAIENVDHMNEPLLKLIGDISHDEL